MNATFRCGASSSSSCSMKRLFGIGSVSMGGGVGGGGGCRWIVGGTSSSPLVINGSPFASNVIRTSTSLGIRFETRSCSSLHSSVGVVRWSSSLLLASTPRSSSLMYPTLSWSPMTITTTTNHNHNHNNDNNNNNQLLSSLSSSSWNHQSKRSFAVVPALRRKKKKVKISKKKQHEKKMKAKREAIAQDVEGAKARDEQFVSVQHKQWVEFQKSIAVQGFETGQMTQILQGHTLTRLQRAQKRAQKRLERRVLDEKERRLQIQTGEYPSLRLSDDETQRLLEQAKAAIPVRTGKRGTKRIFRNFQRWWRVRKCRKKYRRQIAAANVRKDLARQRNWKIVKAMIQFTPHCQAADRSYQWEAFQRWVARVKPPTNTTTGPEIEYDFSNQQQQNDARI